MTKFFKITCCIVLLLNLFSFRYTYASIVSNGKLPYDEELKSQLDFTIEPKNLVSFVNIDSNNTEYTSNCDLWVNSINYFFNVKNYSLSPFNLFICSDKIYEFNNSLFLRNQITNDSNSLSILVLGKYNNKNNEDLIKILKNTNINVIKRNKLILEYSYSDKKLNVKFEETKDDELSSWVRSNLNPKLENEYIINLSSFNKINENLYELTGEIINNSPYPIFGSTIGARNIFLLDKSDNISESYNKANWVTPNLAKVIADSELIAPFEKKSFTINLNKPKTKLVTSFVFANSNKLNYPNSEVTIDFGNNIAKINNTSVGNIENKKHIIEVLSTPTRYLNTRNLPKLNSKILGKIYQGEQYLLKDSKSGWFMIDFKGKSVWISSKYAKILY